LSDGSVAGRASIVARSFVPKQNFKRARRHVFCGTGRTKSQPTLNNFVAVAALVVVGPPALVVGHHAKPTQPTLLLVLYGTPRRTVGPRAENGELPRMSGSVVGASNRFPATRLQHCNPAMQQPVLAFFSGIERALKSDRCGPLGVLFAPRAFGLS